MRKRIYFRFKEKLHYNLILTICSVILFFLIPEITLRLIKFQVNQTDGYLKFVCFNIAADKYNIPRFMYDPNLFWRYDSKNFFRGRYHSLIKPKNTYRIICLGDSVTQGYATPPIYITLNDTYPYKLEEILNKRNNNSSITYEVINAGCGGYSSFQGVRFLKTELLKYNPDLLIVLFAVNDKSLAILYSDKEQPYPNKMTIRLQTMFNHSMFYKFYRQGLFYLLSIFKKDKPQNKRRVSPEDYGKNLREMARLAKERNIPILLIKPAFNVDSKITLWEMGAYVDNYGKIFDDFINEKIPFIDMSSVFKQKKDAFKYFYDTCHFTPQGNQIVAEAIYDVLVRMNIVSVYQDINKGYSE